MILANSESTRSCRKQFNINPSRRTVNDKLVKKVDKKNVHFPSPWDHVQEVGPTLKQQVLNTLSL